MANHNPQNQDQQTNHIGARDADAQYTPLPLASPPSPMCSCVHWAPTSVGCSSTPPKPKTDGLAVWLAGVAVCVRKVQVSERASV